MFQKIDFHVVPYTCDNVGGQGITAYCIAKPQIELKKERKNLSDSHEKLIPKYVILSKNQKKRRRGSSSVRGFQMEIDF